MLLQKKNSKASWRHSQNSDANMTARPTALSLIKFKTYFIQNYFHHAEVWSEGHRKECGINTTMQLEALHRDCNEKKQSRTTVRLWQLHSRLYRQRTMQQLQHAAHYCSMPFEVTCNSPQCQKLLYASFAYAGGSLCKINCTNQQFTPSTIRAKKICAAVPLSLFFFFFYKAQVHCRRQGEDGKANARTADCSMQSPKE